MHLDDGLFANIIFEDGDVIYFFVSGNQGSLINEAVVLSYKEDSGGLEIDVDKTNLMNCYIDRQSRLDPMVEVTNFFSLKKYIGSPYEW